MANEAKRATLYRMVMPDHVCPYGLKSKWQLERHGFAVDDHWLRTRTETDAFKVEHGVETTPQTFIDGRRIGGNDDLRRFFGRHVPAKGETSYKPVIAVFGMAAALGAVRLQLSVRRRRGGGADGGRRAALAVGAGRGRDRDDRRGVGGQGGICR